MTKTLVYSVKVHSCPLELDWLPFPKLEERPEKSRFVIKTDRGVWYRALGLKCSCKKMVTTTESGHLLKTGQAQHLYNRAVECDEKMIWMEQQMQVPRIDLIAAADVERAYIDKIQQYIDYVEEVHQMHMECRAELVVEYPYNWVDPTEYYIFNCGVDQRTNRGPR